MTSPLPVVVDASVAVKWVLQEDFSAQADALFVAVVGAHQQFVGPPPLLAEVTSVIYQRTRSRDPRRHLSLTEANRALARVLSFPLVLLSPTPLYEQAFTFALTY